MDNTIKGSIIGALITGIISLLIFILGNFSTQSTIEEKTVETLSGYFDSVNKDMSYEQALQTIYKENESLKNDILDLNKQLDGLNQKIENKQAEIDNQSSQEEVDKVVQTATEYWNNSDFVQSLSLLKNYKSKSVDIELLYSQYSNDYCTYILQQVDDYIENMQYNDAVALINDSLILVYDSSILDQKIEEIENSKPNNLMDAIKPYEKYGYTEKINSDYMQMGGNKYYNGFQLGDGYEISYALFNLNGKHNKITCTIGHIDESGEADKTLLVIGDNTIIETIEINYQSLPKEYTINVKGINQLKFERVVGTTQTGIANIVIQ